MFGARDLLNLLLLPSLFVMGEARAGADTRVRVATYNIWYLNDQISDARRRNLHELVQQLDAHVIGLQEVADRAAVRLVFPADTWQVVIDDQSDDDQDVAVAVRSPARLKGVAESVRDVDAEDRDFAFEGRQYESGFSNRRDLLAVEVELPGGGSFTVFVHHAKSRREGRMASEERRIFAAREMTRLLKSQFVGRDFVVLGDFNDNPDDASLNVLETADPNAKGGPENADGPFLVNLGESLVAEDRVSHGLGPRNIVGSGPGARIETSVRGSRAKNNDMRGRGEEVGPVLLDQLLIPVSMKSKYASDSIRVFDSPTAIRGGQDKPSDHLPVFADFLFPKVPGPAGGAEPSKASNPEPGKKPERPTPPGGSADDVTLRIFSLLPNPEGEDEGREEITLLNRSKQSVELAGWSLRNQSGKRFDLRGAIKAGQKMTVRPAAGEMPLSNKGGTVELVDPQGKSRQAVSYDDPPSGKVFQANE